MGKVCLLIGTALCEESMVSSIYRVSYFTNTFFQGIIHVITEGEKLKSEYYIYKSQLSIDVRTRESEEPALN